MMQCNCTARRTCPAGCASDDAADVPRTVSAGEVCGSECAAIDTPIADARLAMIEFPIQSYKTGFCPCEALMKGTLFPELVSPYTRGC